jgi:hypothetical protein
MAVSRLFLGDRDEIRLIPYGWEQMEGVMAEFRECYGLGKAKKSLRKRFSCMASRARIPNGKSAPTSQRLP